MPPAASMRSASVPRGNSSSSAQASTASSCLMVEFVAQAVEGELDDRLHRRAELDLQSLRLDQPQIFFRRLLGIEREIIGGAEPLVEGDVGAELGHPGLIGLGADVGEFVLQGSLRCAGAVVFGRLRQFPRSAVAQILVALLPRLRPEAPRRPASAR